MLLQYTACLQTIILKSGTEKPLGGPRVIRCGHIQKSEIKSNNEMITMVKKSHGFRRRTRKLMTKKVREKGQQPVSQVLIDYEVGQRVDIIIDPAVHKGMPHYRYHGRTGEVIEKRGRGIVVKVNLGKKEKTLIVRPEHLRPSKS
jgi:large subunit ribosomal protein L21e